MPGKLLKSEIDTPRTLAVIISSITIAVVVAVLPAYIFIVTLFFKKSRSTRYTAYWIMANVGLIDCLFLVASAHASLVTLREEIFHPAIFEFSSAIHCVYEWVLHYLSLILAINRVVCILDIKLKHDNSMFQALAILVWSSVLVILYFFHKYGMYLVYYYNDNAFAQQVHSVDDWNNYTVVYDCYFYGDLTAVALVFLCYSVVVIAVVVQKFQFRQNFKIEAHELRVFVQGLVTFLPGATYWALTLIASFNFSEAPFAINVVFSILPKLVPVLNLCGYVTLNTYVRQSLRDVVYRVVDKKTPSVKPISLGSGMVVSVANSRLRC